MTFKKFLLEKYYTYNIPTDKKKLMYDFYVLSYLYYLLSQPSKGNRDLDTDTEDSIRDAARSLFLELKQQLLYAVFYAVCAEFRHVEDHKNSNRSLLQGLSQEYKTLYKYYLRYYVYHRRSMDLQDELTNVFNIRKPSSKRRVKEIEKKTGNSGYVVSYKAANYALKKTGMSKADFMNMAAIMFGRGTWNSSYGGEAWARIAKGWLMLDNAESIDAPKSFSGDEKKSKSERPTIPVAIDHVYDLQHNTDTVFNKLKEYYNGGYEWIKTALDDKANVKSYFDLLKNASGTVRTMAPKILYNKLGEAQYKKEIETKTPSGNVRYTETEKQDSMGGITVDDGLFLFPNNYYWVKNLDSLEKFAFKHNGDISGATIYLDLDGVDEVSIPSIRMVGQLKNNYTKNIKKLGLPNLDNAYYITLHSVDEIIMPKLTKVIDGIHAIKTHHIHVPKLMECPNGGISAPSLQTLTIPKSIYAELKSKRYIHIPKNANVNFSENEQNTLNKYKGVEFNEESNILNISDMTNFNEFMSKNKFDLNGIDIYIHVSGSVAISQIVHCRSVNIPPHIHVTNLYLPFLTTCENMDLPNVDEIVLPNLTKCNYGITADKATEVYIPKIEASNSAWFRLANVKKLTIPKTSFEHLNAIGILHIPENGVRFDFSDMI